MAHARYYRFGGEPMAYMANWNGLPPAAARRGNRQLGLGATKRPAPTRKLRVPSVPRHTATLETVPLRPSGPEPLDPGAMPSWQLDTAYKANYVVQPVGADVDASGPFGLSRNETRLLALGLAGTAALVLWKKRGAR